MPTECSAEKFEFGEVSGRVVVAGFDGGAITSDAGALLLDATGLSGISCMGGIMGRKGDPYGTTESTGDPG